MNNNKMYYVRNIEELKNGNIDYNTYEYELHVDAWFIGEFIGDPYEILLWELGLHAEGEERKLILRIKEADSLSSYENYESTRKNAYYHGGGIADEIVALASLFLRRRIKLIHLVRQNDVPRIISEKGYRWNDKELVSGETNLQTLSDWFSLIEDLDEKYHQKFILSARLYHRSILMIEEDPDLAYLSLVSSIEALCQDHPLKEEPNLSEIYPELDYEIENLITDEQAKNRLRYLFLKKEKFISRRFVAFIIDYTDSEFWKYGNRPKYGKIEADELPKYLRNIYAQRSKTLHEGQAFPPIVLHPRSQNDEICCGLSLMHRGKKWNPSDYIPSIHFFERLVSHVLTNFVKRHQVNKNEK